MSESINVPRLLRSGVSVASDMIYDLIRSLIFGKKEEYIATKFFLDPVLPPEPKNHEKDIRLKT